MRWTNRRQDLTPAQQIRRLTLWTKVSTWMEEVPITSTLLGTVVSRLAQLTCLFPLSRLNFLTNSSPCSSHGNRQAGPTLGSILMYLRPRSSLLGLPSINLASASHAPSLGSLKDVRAAQIANFATCALQVRSRGARRFFASCNGTWDPASRRDAIYGVSLEEFSLRSLAQATHSRTM